MRCKRCIAVSFFPSSNTEETLEPHLQVFAEKAGMCRKRFVKSIRLSPAGALHDPNFIVYRQQVHETAWTPLWELRCTSLLLDLQDFKHNLAGGKDILTFITPDPELVTISRGLREEVQLFALWQNHSLYTEGRK